MTKATFGIDNEVNHQLCVQQLKSANHHRLLLTAFYKTNRLLVHGDLNSKDFQILKSPILHIFPKKFSKLFFQFSILIFGKTSYVLRKQA